MAEFLKRLVQRTLGAVGLSVSRSHRRSWKRSWTFSRTLGTGDGYWHLHPMPSRVQLEEYYRAEYWKSFRGTPIPPLLNLRDIEHFELLITGNWMPLGGRFVNFGAGHGGVSFLAIARGMMVVNVDPFAAPHLEAAGAKVYPDLPRDGRADVVYASHSLEHVSDVHMVLEGFAESLNESGILFLEVPDSSRFWPSSEPLFEEPHTYYFTRAFFESIGHGLTTLSIQHRKRSMSGERTYSTPATAMESEVLQIVLAKS